MPIYQQVLGFNQMFSHLTEPPIIINTIVNNTEEDKEAIREMISSRYSSDMISLLPSCRCGATKGEFSIGVTCDYCNTQVKSSIEDEIEPSIWFSKPEGVASLINPIILILLKNRFRKSGYSIMQWIMDTKYSPGIKEPKIIKTLEDDKIPRGYNSFVENFDTIMNYLFELRDFQMPKKQRDYLRDLIAENRDIIFSEHLPLPNKAILIIENTNVGTYVDSIIVGAVNAIQMLVSIDKNFYNQTSKAKENRTTRALFKLTDFYEEFIKINIGKDNGQFRKHIYGTRTNFSFRAVITSLTDAHRYDEMHVPWGIGLTAFRPHIINKLGKIGFDLNASIALILGHIDRYHPLLDKILKEIINESPSKSIPCIYQRNPSLLQGSAQKLGITKFKTDPNDHTVSFSILIVRAFNADLR